MLRFSFSKLIGAVLFVYLYILTSSTYFVFAFNAFLNLFLKVLFFIFSFTSKEVDKISIHILSLYFKEKFVLLI